MKHSPVPPGRFRSLATIGLTALVSLMVLLPAHPASAAGDPVMRQDRIAGAYRLPVPENYHARYDPAVAEQASKTGSPIMRTAIDATEQVAADALAARVPALHISRDEVSQLPVMVLSYESGQVLATPSRKVANSPDGAARAFLQANKALYAASDSDLASLKTRYVTSPEGGATIVKMDQYAGGIQVFDAELAVVMTKQNEVVATSGRFYPQISKAPSAASFALPPTDAISRGIKDLTGRIVGSGDFAIVRGEDEAGYTVYGFTPDRAEGVPRLLSEDVRIRKVLYPLAAGRFVPSYYLELWVAGEPEGSGPVFSYVISAEDGAMLFRNNLTANDTYNYRVYADGTGDKRPWDGPTGTIGTPHPTGIPNGYQAPFISAPMISVESLLGPTDPWLPPAATVTTGNNTEAYLDITGADGFSAGDIRGMTSSAGTFDYQYNSTLNVSDATNRQAAVVGMFYQVNWLHDVWYQHGFTEAAGNAQTDNYGRGGVAGDSLKAEGQDQSGTDNANMSTPADGGRPKMQMYIFTAGGLLNPTREGTFDMLIVGHEMGHYISNRLIGNGSGLTNRQGGSMGEGWGDFNCLLTTAQPTDDTQGTYAIGGQTDIYFCGATFVDNYYY
ncbi:MAG TPA: M36 family metallopeptidase, partial [Blastocatellia bacterium]|nr:M36 family metallopeptidase [Blastocatellia bacterium]